MPGKSNCIAFAGIVSSMCHANAYVSPNSGIRKSPVPFRAPRRGYQSVALLRGSIDDDNENPRDGFGRMLRVAFSSGMSEDIKQGALVVARADLPSQGIYMDQSYELRSIFKQRLNPETNVVEKIPLISLEEDVGTGYVQYVTLFSPMYHEECGPVVVTPEEAGLVAFRTEVVDSIIFALPVLGFWLATCFTFARMYNEKYGGNFFDALFRT